MELTSDAYYGGKVPSYVLYLLLTHCTGEVIKAQRGDAPFLELPSKSQGTPLSLGLKDKCWSSIFLSPQTLPILRQNSTVLIIGA